MDVSSDLIEVAADARDAFVRVHGRGSFKNSPALKQFGIAMKDRGCRMLIVELGDCLGMDSTFMGVLAGLAILYRKGEGEVLLRNLSDKNRTLVETLGLNQLIRIEQGGDAQSRRKTTRLDTTSDRKAIAETMLEAHETLVTATPENVVRFKDVLAYLREDVGRMTDDAKAGKS